MIINIITTVMILLLQQSIHFNPITGYVQTLAVIGRCEPVKSRAQSGSHFGYQDTNNRPSWGPSIVTSLYNWNNNVDNNNDIVSSDSGNYDNASLFFCNTLQY